MHALDNFAFTLCRINKFEPVLKIADLITDAIQINEIQKIRILSKITDHITFYGSAAEIEEFATKIADKIPDECMRAEIFENIEWHILEKKYIEGKQT